MKNIMKNNIAIEKFIMSDSQQSSYRSIFKATSLFGGVQIYQILIQVIRSKFIAVLLGPSGVGMIGLYQSGIQLIQNITNMGLAQSAVRDVSEANGTGDIECITRIVSVIKKLVLITGLLGFLAVIVFSPVLSLTSFSSNKYIIPFIILSIIPLFEQLSAGQKVVLQGTRRLKDLALSSAIGITIGLFLSVPLYFIYGLEGIVPTLVLSSITTFFVSWLYARRFKIKKINITFREAIKDGKQMLVMGVSMSINGILGTAAAFVIRSYIQHIGGLIDVGLYQAGFIIITTYVGMIFNAIVTDFYPRLASVNKDNDKCNNIINQQAEIATMILAPMLTICLVFMPFVLRILYSDSFLGANDFISWACLGMMLRLSAWVISYLFVAKAESKLFIINELLGNLHYIILSIIGYNLMGLCGLGIAFAIDYVIYLLQVYFIANKLYNFKFTKSFLYCYGLQFIFVTCSMVIISTTSGFTKYVLGILVIMFSISYGIYGLNKRINITEIIKSRFKTSK